MDEGAVRRAHSIIHQVCLLVSPKTVPQATRLLLGTCAVESAFKHRRQIGFEDSEYGGAFGLFQVEASSVLETIERVNRNAGLRDRLWMSCIPDIFGIPFWRYSEHEVCLRLKEQSWDVLAALLARLHYLWVPEPIPTTDQGMAEYWLSKYNRYGSVKSLIRKGSTRAEAEVACKVKFMKALQAAADVVDKEVGI